MKQLTLVRHAKSSWKDPQLADFDRPLNKRGLRDLPGLASRAGKMGLRPDLIISSGANRAINTAVQLARGIGYPPEEIENIAELYHARSETLMNLLQSQSDIHKHIAVVGHNPALELLATYLTGERLRKFPTCGLLHIPLSITCWTELAESCGTLEIFDYPKLHV
ncbi:SixA phosphatase family protein [Aliamphritea ceti]|uniref:SixA phosphatase family protein n=1 Tax=Aliamphritea ceti TaxID=1524258 RepID=UPI0021C373BA|nr:histidine phosphatase family protein [Aliamphritea ceti]